MNPYYGAYPPQGLPQGVNGLGGWQNSQPMGYPGLGNQNGYQQASVPALPGRVIRDIAENWYRMSVCVRIRIRCVLN